MRVLAKLLTVVIVGSVLGAARVQADEDCIPIHAKAKGKFTGPTTSVSQITGGGILNGTTAASLAITGVISPGVVSYEGTLVLTTKHGTLTLDLLDGVFNVETGEFSNSSVVVAGTGRFEDATGFLLFRGHVLADGVSFVDDSIRGIICLDDEDD